MIIGFSDGGSLWETSLMIDGTITGTSRKKEFENGTSMQVLLSWTWLCEGCSCLKCFMVVLLIACCNKLDIPYDYIIPWRLIHSDLAVRCFHPIDDNLLNPLITLHHGIKQVQWVITIYQDSLGLLSWLNSDNCSLQYPSHRPMPTPTEGNRTKQKISTIANIRKKGFLKEMWKDVEGGHYTKCIQHREVEHYKGSFHSTWNFLLPNFQ